MRHASLTAYFNGILNSGLIRRFRQSIDGVFLWRSVRPFYKSEKGGVNVGWGHGYLLEYFGGELALVQPRGSYLEAGLDDMRSSNRLLEAIGCDEALQLHLPSAKSLCVI